MTSLPLPWLLRGLTVSRAALVAENVPLRQQLAVLQRTAPRPRLRWRDRLFWSLLARWFAGWRSWLAIVQPEAVLRWHRAGFRRFWRWRSRRGKPGRPSVGREVIPLIKRMARDNATWGAPRIQAELMLLGHNLAESAVAR